MADIGFTDQVPSLPDGGGSVAGIGATFTPDLSTGTGGLTIPIDIPNGPNDIAPRLSLQYSTAAGNGAFGLGFAIGLPRVLIDTEYGFPVYDGHDPILLEGAGPILPIGGGTWRPQVDGGAWRIQSSGAGFTLTSRDGIVYTLGVDAPGRLADPVNPAHVFAWLLESIADPLGYTATFAWRTDRGQLYLDTISYGIYRVVFGYEARPDAFRSGRSGFSITTGLRCSTIELQLAGDAQPVLRRWTLGYTADPANGASLLTSVTLAGLETSGAVLAAPALTLTYTAGSAPSLTRLGAAASGLPALAAGPARRAELVDWNGDGLPDVLQIAAGGEAYVWPNAGDGTFLGPLAAGTAPGFASADAALAFADMDGDGFADLIRYDLPLAGYVPRVSGGGFGQPVSWTQAPPPPVASIGVRIVDLNGDGIPDMLTSSDYGLALYYRAGAAGWSPAPQLVPASVAPEVDLTDPHVFLADMTGDGSYDIVKVTGAGVTYWPYLGNGVWDVPVVMADSPSLPFDVDISRVFVSDVDGDGIADLIYLGAGQVTTWVNQSGLAFGPAVTIDYVPTAAIAAPRLADMMGSGTAGLLWTTNGPFGAGHLYFYLAFAGVVAPRLLAQVDNGIGQLTTIAYTTSAQEAARALAAGTAWSTTLPIALPVVKSVSIDDQVTGTLRASRYTYRDGRFDGVLREFAGFGMVTQRDEGDAGIPGLQTVSRFNVGVDPVSPEAPLNLATRQSLRAIRGRLVRRERYGLDGSPAAANPYDVSEYNWTVVTQATAGGTVYVPRLVSTVQTVFERTAAAVSAITNTNAAWDTNGNVTDTTEVATSAGGTVVQILRSLTSFATDPANRFIAKPWRVQQMDASGTIVADQVIVYDGAAEGAVGAQGLVTRRSALAITDSTVTAVYGVATPDFAAYHYYRRSDSQGWWIDQGHYQRSVDASGVHGTVQGPNGGTYTIAYDTDQIFPTTIIDPAGNTVIASYDYRVSRVATLVDASGETFAAGFDALGRLLARIEPGDTAALPTFAFTYDTTQVAVSVTQSMRATSGGTLTVDRRTICAGDGSAAQQRVADETGEIAMVTTLLNARGLKQKEYVAWRPPSSAYGLPPVGTGSTDFSYDALGRLASRTDPDGHRTAWTFAPALVTQVDPTGRTTRSVTDATGRITTIEEQIGGTTLTSTYSFDVKGNLLVHVDAAAQVVRMWYDCFGRVLRVQRPEQDSITVFDAGGNPVETRTPAGITVTRGFDSCNRPVTVALPSSAVPVVAYTYHDAGTSPPPNAGAHTEGGRCVSISDQGGVTIFDYDARGRTVLKRTTPVSGPEYVLRSAYRADGQLDSITYPAGKTSTLSVACQYNKRGLLSAIPGAVTAIAYDLQGRRTSTAYANGVVTSNTYDNAGLLTGLDHAGPAGSLRQTAFTRDAAGNLTGIASPDATLAASFGYDDLHRLISATIGGSAMTFAYDAVGNITQKSDVGAYAYGENGQPATCLTSAGTAKFTYTALGQMEQTPWGAQSFDAFGRLVAIAGGANANFVYDHAGARVATTFTSGGSTTTRLSPDLLYAIEDGTLVNYLFDGQRFFARDSDGGGRVYLHEDHVGSIVLLTDAAGAVVDAIRYDAFGAIIARTTAGSTVPVGFAQGLADDATGLLYLHSRYYHPRYGRFVSPDAIVPGIFLPIAWNSFAYCANNPQTYADPSGRAWWQILVGALAVIAIIALIAITIVTCGVASPATGAAGAAVVTATVGATTAGGATAAGLAVAVGVGLVAGGIIGGVAAWKAGGDAGDIALGALVGAAIGGWGAFGATEAGSVITSGLLTATKSLAFADIVAGAAAGAINGAAMGLAVGFAGGKGTLDQTLSDVALGALVGAVLGGALGGAKYALTGSAPTAPNLDPNASPVPAQFDPAADTGLQNPASSTTGSAGTGVVSSGSPWAMYGAQVAGRFALTSATLYPIAAVVVVDSASGSLDLYGSQILQWLKQNNITV
jgi:RHS repeat-associated protein